MKNQHSMALSIKFSHFFFTEKAKISNEKIRTLLEKSLNNLSGRTIEINNTEIDRKIEINNTEIACWGAGACLFVYWGAFINYIDSIRNASLEFILSYFE